MKAQLRHFTENLRQPWLLAVLLVCIIPLFPEYICPVLAGGSLYYAHVEIRQSGRVFAVGTIGKCLLAYIAYMALGLLYSPFFWESLLTLAGWIVIFSVYLSMTAVLTDLHKLDTALFCITAVAGITGFIGCAQYILWLCGIEVDLLVWGWVDRAILSVFPGLGMQLDVVGLRICSTFTNPNMYAEYAVIVIPFVSYYAFDGERTGFRTFCRFCLLACIGALMFTFSRGAYFSLIFICIVFAVANSRRIVTVAVSTMAVLLLIPQPVIERFMSVGGGIDVSMAERLRIWEISTQVIARHPIFGTGPGFGYIYNLMRSSGIFAPHAHNLMLQLLIEGGIIGLAIMVFTGYQLFRAGTALSARPAHRAAGIALLSFGVGFVVMSVNEHTLFSPKLLAPFMMIMALCDVLAKLRLAQRHTPAALYTRHIKWKQLLRVKRK